MQFQMSRVKPLLFTLMFGVSAERNREIQAECKVTLPQLKLAWEIVTRNCLPYLLD